jgi:hypothetical protein
VSNTASVFIGTRITDKTFTGLGYVSNTASVFIGSRITDKAFTGLGYVSNTASVFIGTIMVPMKTLAVLPT